MFSRFGAPALSQFRLDHSLRVLRAVDERVTALDSRWLHFVDDARPLADSELDLLAKLDYGARSPGAAGPRLATPASARSPPGRARPPTSCTFAASMPSAREARHGVLHRIDRSPGVGATAAPRGSLHVATESVWIGRSTPRVVFVAAAAAGSVAWVMVAPLGRKPRLGPGAVKRRD